MKNALKALVFASTLVTSSLALADGISGPVISGPVIRGPVIIGGLNHEKKPGPVNPEPVVPLRGQASLPSQGQVR